VKAAQTFDPDVVPISGRLMSVRASIRGGSYAASDAGRKAADETWDEDAVTNGAATAARCWIPGGW